MSRLSIAITFLLVTAVSLSAAPANWPDGVDVPSWWPEEIGLYLGSTVEEVDHAEDKGLPEVDTLVPEAGADVEAITEWYRARFEHSGWEVWETKDLDHSLRFTTQSKSLDKRMIVRVIKPKHFLFNKSEHPRVTFVVYRSIPFD